MKISRVMCKAKSCPHLTFGKWYHMIYHEGAIYLKNDLGENRYYPQSYFLKEDQMDMIREIKLNQLGI